MIKILMIIQIISIIITLPSVVLAVEKHNNNCTACHKLTEKEALEILKPTGGIVKSIKPAPINGMFELLVERDGKQGLIYLDYSKKYLLQGLVINMTTLQPVASHPLEQIQPKKAAFVDLQSIPIGNAIRMGNINGSKKLYVFTDPDCPYCRRFHEELRKLEKMLPDLTIYVMLYPLQMHPKAYDKSRIILETMSQDLLNKAFEGKEVPKPVKEESKLLVDAIIKFANSNGIEGTPTFIMPNGKIEVGAWEAENLKRALELNRQ